MKSIKKKTFNNFVHGMSYESLAFFSFVSHSHPLYHPILLFPFRKLHDFTHILLYSTLDFGLLQKYFMQVCFEFTFKHFYYEYIYGFARVQSFKNKDKCS